MKKGFALCGSTILVLLLIGLLLYEPQHCPLCQAEQSDVPCLIDLHTGEIGEICVGHDELSDDTSSFVFYFVEIAGCEGYCDTGSQCCYLRTDVKEGAMNRLTFCRTCRAKLHDVRHARYAILDLRATEAVAYPIDKGIISIGEYQIGKDEDGVRISLDKSSKQVFD